ncbi:hypothetical protein QJS04_geneDACA010026 [Acorus gramineus]|uniref:Dirigent protein n=1 Tax=Acorus gramineus TaxID=55184 RepID=A0AAV9BFX8_ACOGR|nr:hypothetical protein QJS04_geneDACA010026 [Acorus gramineus]
MGASTTSNPLSISILLLITILAATATATAFKLGKEKTTHLHFYFHDIVTGPDPTTVRVAAANSSDNSATFFGTVVMIDDPLTAGPDIRSKLIGRAEGLYGFASKEEVALGMTFNFVFLEGEFEGSTLAVLGRNTILKNPREMAVVGGTGAFRFARGFTRAKTYSFDLVSGNAVVEYDVFVVHH